MRQLEAALAFRTKSKRLQGGGGVQGSALMRVAIESHSVYCIRMRILA